VEKRSTANRSRRKGGIGKRDNKKNRFLRAFELPHNEKKRKNSRREEQTPWWLLDGDGLKQHPGKERAEILQRVRRGRRKSEKARASTMKLNKEVHLANVTRKNSLLC